MNKKHYHVICGNFGSIPDTNIYTSNLSNAKDELKQIVQIIKQEEKLIGSIKNKWLETKQGNYYFSIEQCNENCEEIENDY